MVRINGTNFDLDYCGGFTPAMLQNIYNGESSETIGMLVEAINEKKKIDDLHSDNGHAQGAGVSDFSDEKRNANKSIRKNSKK